MKRIRLASLLVVATVAFGALAGCSSGAGDSASSAGSRDFSNDGLTLNSAETSPEMSQDMAAAPDSSATPKLSPEQVEAGSGSTNAAQQLISTAEVQLSASNPEQAAEAITKAVTRLNGSVESLTVQQSTGDTPAGAQLSVRVPPAQLDAAIQQFEQVGDVLSQSRSTQDVTTEYVDLEARIKALETSVKRLNDLMAGAATTTELIEAEGALTQRQQELDGLRAQFKALDGQVSQATIWVSITTPNVLPGGGPGSFWEGLLTGLNSLVAAGAGALVLLGVLLPWLAVAAILAAVVVVTLRSRRSRRTRRARAAQPDDQTPAQP